MPKSKEPELLLVDGYNVLFARTALGEPGERGRERLVNLLGQYLAGRRDLRAIVFFDTAERTASGRSPHNVSVRFVASADQAILKLLRDHPHPSRCLVVTADHKDIGRPARQLGARLLSPAELARLLSRPRARTRADRTDQALSALEVEQWLNWFDSERGK